MRPYIATVAPTITAGAYSAGDVVGGLLTFTFATGYRQCAGFIRSIRLSDDDNEGAALKLHLFLSQPASIADNAAFAPSFADLCKRFAVVAIGTADYATINSNKQAIIYPSSLALDFQTDTQSLYGYLVTDGGPTYASTSDLVIALTAMITND